MSDFRTLSDRVLTSPQIEPQDIEAARALGVTLVINNRPDGEEADQPTSAEIEAAARAAGLDYRAMPMAGVGMAGNYLDAMVEALDSAEGKVLAFCRSGTRSTMLWSLAQAATGHDPEDIAAAAGAAGYDVTPIRPAIDMLSARARD